jgi:hypothetical protein
MKENDMGRACRTYNGYAKRLQSVGREAGKGLLERGRMKNIRIDLPDRVYTGFGWLRI